MTENTEQTHNDNEKTIGTPEQVSEEVRDILRDQNFRGITACGSAFSEDLLT